MLLDGMTINCSKIFTTSKLRTAILCFNELSLLLKDQVLKITLEIPSSNVHVIFTVDPRKKTSFVPSGCEVILPKQQKYLYF